jgi:threonine dehydrogenase-like Zn-dependent dehydrogenase
MKAVIKATEKAGSLELADMPKPEPKPHEVLVRIGGASICYTDYSILNNTYVGRKPVTVPMIMGHEGAGTIAALGDEVEGCTVGDRVVLEPIAGCGYCRACKNNRKNMCPNWDHIGITRHGTFAEYIAIAAEQTHNIPDGVSFTEAAVLEPLGLAVRSLEQSKPMVGETVAIIGPGSLGMMHLLAYRAAGASKVIMIGVESDRARLDSARQMGADHTVIVDEQDPVESVLKVTDGLGANIVVETANSPKATGLAFDLAAPLGRVVLFGLYPEATFKPVKMLRNGVTAYGDVGAASRHILRAMSWVASGKVRIRDLIRKTYKLEKCAEAFAAAHKGETIKAVFEI